MAARVEELSLRRDEQQRFRLRQAGTEHHVTAFRIDPASGALTKHGEPIRLPTRPIHMTLDIPSENILVAFNNPSALHIYRINKDFTPGEEVKQGPMDAGIFAHQVRVTPDNRQVVLVTRGNEGTADEGGRPGRAESLRLQERRALERGVHRAGRRREFGPRHLDFHPTKPWMYLSIETQNKMYTYRMDGGKINPEIVYRADTLAEPKNIRARQAAGTVHVHPNGRFLYGANRAQATVEFQGKKVFKGGENSIVVYSINQSTGEPTVIQHIETHDIHPRTFHIDPSGRLMVVAAQPAGEREGRRHDAHGPRGPVGVPHRRRRQVHVRAQVRRRRRRQGDVLDGDGAAVGAPRREEKKVTRESDEI